MKKTLFFLMLFAIVAFTSCSKESTTDPGEPSNITFNLAALTPATKTTNVTRYVVEVYTAADTNTRLHRIEQTGSTVTITLNNNTNYVCLFWADEGTKDDNANGAYNALDLKNVLLNSGKEMEEAFFAKKDVSGSISTHNITLTRPIAQVNFVATDVVTANTNLIATYSQYPGFNVLTEDAAGTPVSTSKTFNSAATTGTLGSLFTFVSKVGINMTFTTVYNALVSNTMPNTPLKANFKTNILGNYAIGFQDFTAIIVLDEYWANTIEWVEINTGSKWIQVADRNALKDGTHGATAGNTHTDYGYFYQWSYSGSTSGDMNSVDRAYKACFDFAEGSGAWRLPTKAEWTAILGQVGPHTDNANRKLKFDTPTTTWKLFSERSGQTDKFVYLPLAGRNETTAGSSGQYTGIEGQYWSSTGDAGGAWSASFNYSGESQMIGVSDQQYALSVRCVKDV